MQWLYCIVTCYIFYGMVERIVYSHGMCVCAGVHSYNEETTKFFTGISVSLGILNFQVFKLLLSGKVAMCVCVTMQNKTELMQSRKHMHSRLMLQNRKEQLE